MKNKKLLISACLLLIVMITLGVCISKYRGDNNPEVSTSVQNPDESTKVRYTTGTVYGYFDTVTVIDGYTSTLPEFKEIVNEILAELDTYHKLYDIYNAYDGINNIHTINQLYDGEHKVVTVDSKIIDMLLYAKEMYVKTNGKMNVAMGSVLSIWHDYRDAADKYTGVGKLPPMADLQNAAEHTDINNLIIDEENGTVYLADPQMKLDVGAIAKGYAVEMIAQLLESKGMTGFVINVGGNVRTIGKRGDGKNWSAGIEDPIDYESGYIAYLGLAGESIVTSGSYQRYYIVDGKEYHHIIDGETLMPATYYVGVSIICKSSAVGDALSTALFCMPLEEGMALIESLEDVEAMWTLPNGTRYKSSGFSYYEDQFKK